MEQLLKLFLKRLVQLDASNRSLYLPKLSKEKDIDLHDFDFSLSKSSFNIIEKLIGGKSLPLCAITDARDSASNQNSLRLKKILRKEKAITEETGAKDLYVGYPFVHGVASGGLPIRCPLLFFPVSIEQKENHWLLIPQTDEPVSFNKSFLLAYAHFFQSKYDEELAETDAWELGNDALSFRTALYELLKKSSLEINFNQDLFQDKIQAFTEFSSREAFLESHPESLLKLYPEAVLGIFPQAGSYLEPDYQWLIENQPSNSLESFFEQHQSLPSNTDSQTTLGIQSNSFINLVKEEQTFTPFKIDIFQENAIKAVKYGHSLVVQGPPGTGKSQLICNLAADFMARGKNVLIVCQKRAALDVVKKRLSEGGIGDFVSLVHDFNYDRKSIFSKIDDQISKLELYKEQNYQLDTVFLERNFQQASRRIDQLTDELETFRKILFDSGACGLSPNELYNTSNPQNPTISIADFKKFPAAIWEESSRKINSYQRYHSFLGAKNYEWNDRVNFASFTWEDKRQIEKLLPELAQKGNEILSSFNLIVKKNIQIGELDELKSQVPVIKEFIQELEYPIRADYVFLSPNPRLSKKKIETLVEGCRTNKANGLKFKLSENEIDDLILKLNQHKTAQSSLFSRIKWSLFSPDKKVLDKLCLEEGLLNFSKSKAAIETKINSSKALFEIKKEIKSQPWGKHFPENDEDISNWGFELIKALLLKESIQKWVGEHPVFQDIFKQKDTLESLKKLVAILRLWTESTEEWQDYVSIIQIKQIISSPTFLEKSIETLNKDFDFLCEFDQLIAQLSSIEKSTIDALMDQENPSSVFDNSIRIAWLNHLEEQNPILRTVSTFKMDDLTKELQEKILEKQQLSQNIVQQKVKERVYRNTSFNRLNNRVTYRELQHQVTKKKKIWPLRKVLSEFHEEVFNLMPCWLASPESVSAIFPMEQWFDLVIFDEASQCFSEKGLPAMFRARQIVVTGDSQQLQPNDLYSVRWDDPDDESFESGVDSLLDLCARYLPQVQLSEHYRSRNPSLIEFSNEHFYKNTLRLVPYKKVHREKEPAIQFMHVGGIWENNVNQIEAEKVVTLTLELIKSNPEKEIGIVTFNFRQQNLILDLLEQASVLQRITIPESLIVKNIENIQGDEKDIILFSIGYAPDLKGKLVMNFGTLNAEGGQNRLNVAITRAKEMIYIIASILPQQLSVDEAKHEGPRLLKKYLNFGLMQSELNNNHFTIKSTSRSGLQEKLTNHFNKTNGIKMENGLDFADLAVSNGKSTQLLLTDDNRYYASLSSKDLHGYFLLRLQEKNWGYQQLFARNFWANFEDTYQKLDLQG